MRCTGFTFGRGVLCPSYIGDDFVAEDVFVAFHIACIVFMLLLIHFTCVFGLLHYLSAPKVGLLHFLDIFNFNIKTGSACGSLHINLSVLKASP